MKRTLGLSLVTALMMFPQIVETIYSPALTNIAHAYEVTAEQASLTLSLYFFSFAIGVVFWGRICDVLGRRPAILFGLALYGAASILALVSAHFEVMLAARMLSAFGAAVGSVGIQTSMRDCYKGEQLALVFSIMGIALAISPAIGMLIGTMLTSLWGYQGVFIGLAFLAAGLLIWAINSLPETRPVEIKVAPLMQTFFVMLKDSAIWRSALLVALFNVCLFSYYQLAPFSFEHLGLSPALFGSSGLLLGAGVGMGAWLNKHLLQRGLGSHSRVLLAALLALTGALLVIMLSNSWLFVLPMVFIVMAYGVAIPNILASALTNYSDKVGTAGALFGLFYYLMLGAGLALAGWGQNLGIVLFVCSGLTVILACSSKNRPI